MLSIQKAGIEHVEHIVEIYNEAVTNTTATLDTEIRSHEVGIKWFVERDKNFPVFVALKGGTVAGYAALNKWSERKGYDVTAEISVYIAPAYQGQGIGGKLIEILLADAEETTSLRSILARITQDNPASIYLHEKNGFKTVGVLKEAGLKFGNYLDVTIMQRMLKKKQ
jgi:L-amino acid N-acyltransferase